MNLKIAIVCPMFSSQFSGGAEKHIFDLANLFSKEFEIEVFTTDSINYKTWESSYLEEKFSFPVHKFKTKKQRNLKKFNSLHDKLVQKKNITKKDMDEWIDSQGPFVPDLIEKIFELESEFDIFIFMSYLYYPTIYGIESLQNKSVLIPTFHDEEAIYFPIFKQIFSKQITYAFNTIEELILFHKVFGFEPNKFSVIGPSLKEIQFHEENKLNFSYILYIGRIDLGKGILSLIENFISYKKKIPSNLKLVLVGKGELDFSNEDIFFTGYISEEEKLNYISQAEFLVNPSTLESFSISIMEAWLMEKAVLVNHKSEVLKAHINRSNAGLYYSNSESFFQMVNFLLAEKNIRKEMGKNGKEYVLKNYEEKIILNKFKELFLLANQNHS